MEVLTQMLQAVILYPSLESGARELETTFECWDFN